MVEDSKGGNNGEKEELKEEKIYEVPFDPDDGTKVTNVGAAFEDELRSELVAFLKWNIDYFAWSHLDMGELIQRWLLMIKHWPIIPSNKAEEEKAWDR